MGATPREGGGGGGGLSLSHAGRGFSHGPFPPPHARLPCDHLYVAFSCMLREREKEKERRERETAGEGVQGLFDCSMSERAT